MLIRAGTYVAVRAGTYVAVALCIAMADVGDALSQEKQTVTLSIEKMFCVLCANTVKKALSKVKGVEDVDVDVSRKVAVVRFDQSTVNVQALLDASGKAGFPATPRTP